MAKTWADVRHHFDTDAVAHLATLMPDGSPHSVPVWVGAEEDHLAVFMEADSRKDVNLQRDPRVALSVTGVDNPLDMAFVRGRAVRRIVGDDVWPVIDRIAVQYTGEAYDHSRPMTLFLIEPEVSWGNDFSAG